MDSAYAAVAHAEESQDGSAHEPTCWLEGPSSHRQADGSERTHETVAIVGYCRYMATAKALRSART